MGFHGGEAMLGKPVNVVFIGSCTNGRLEDLQAAARILKGRKVAPGVHLLIVPGSQQIKREAEAAGLADIFRAAGADWRESGCSMCLGMNGDTVAAGQYSVSTSNRNFEGRQGVGARTLLASPLTAAASAVRGRITDPRELHVMEPLKRVRSRTVVIAVQQHRHRSDHSGAIPDHDHQGRPGQAIVRRLALSARTARRIPDFVLNQRRGARLRRCWWPDATSAAAPRASTRPGRCWTTAFARSSAPRSPTSSAATP